MSSRSPADNPQEKELRRALAVNVRRLRREQYTQEELAGAHLSVQYLREIEAGMANPTLKRVAELAVLLEVPALDLFKRPRGRP